MPTVFKLKKGLDIPIKGKAEKTLENSPLASLYAIRPSDFFGFTPKLLVSEGDTVLVGTPILFDKNRPNVVLSSPVAGTVQAVVRGEKRKLLEVIIEPSKKVAKEVGTVYFNAKEGLENLRKEELITLLQKSGVWCFIKERPFGLIADEKTVPRDIFVSGFDSNPLSPDLDYSLTGEDEMLQAGIDAMVKLNGGKKIKLSLSNNVSSVSATKKLKNVSFFTFEGKHPAGNVGVQIHHISPINKGEKVWSITPEHLIIIGRLIKTGTVDMTTVISVAGTGIKKPHYYRVILGALISDVLKENKIEGDFRTISGNVLTGVNVTEKGFLGYNHNTITRIPEGKHHQFMGWAAMNRHKFSNSKSFFSWLTPNKEYDLDTNINGGVRAFVMSGQYEKVLPMNIYPVYLLKAVMSSNIDKMEELGIYEVLPEDMALCEYVCTSKINVQEILREGLELMIKETN